MLIIICLLYVLHGLKTQELLYARSLSPPPPPPPLPRNLHHQSGNSLVTQLSVEQAALRREFLKKVKGAHYVAKRNTASFNNINTPLTTSHRNITHGVASQSGNLTTSQPSNYVLIKSLFLINFYNKTRDLRFSR